LSVSIASASISQCLGICAAHSVYLLCGFAMHVHVAVK